MALQNIRAMRLVQQDLTYGSGAARDLTLYQTVPAAGRPLISTFGFKNSIPATMMPAQTVAANGLMRMVISKMPGFWMTLTGTVNGVAVSIAIPPLNTVFLPAGFSGATGAMTMNNATAPVGVPLADANVRLTFDYIAEA